MTKKAVYFFCNDLQKDPVASIVYDSVKAYFDLKETKEIVDGYPVMEYRDADENVFHFVRLNEVLSHQYKEYLPVLKNSFSQYDFAGLINWHEGANAPDNILTVHSTGDVTTGYYGNIDPMYMTSLLKSIEKNRVANGLEDFKVLFEATHWSGILYDEAKKLIDYPVPLVDIEIGSTSESWSNKEAANILAKSLVEVFDHTIKAPTLLCVGGVHFENAYTEAALNEMYPVNVGHILANQWVVSGEYCGDEGYVKFKKCVDSIQCKIDGIVFHDNLKGLYKELCRQLGEELGVPVFKHKKLRNIAESDLKSMYE